MLDWQHEVEHGEDALLHLPGVPRGAHQDHPALEVHPDDGLRVGRVPLGVRLEPGDRDDRPVWLEALELFGGRAPEELADEQGVPGPLGDDLDVQAVAGVRARVSVHHEYLVEALYVLRGLLQYPPEGLRGERLVDRAPVHPAFGQSVLDYVPVRRGTACALAGHGYQGTAVRERRLPAPDGLLDEPGRRQVLAHRPQIAQPQPFEQPLAKRGVHAHHPFSQVPLCALGIIDDATEPHPRHCEPLRGIRFAGWWDHGLVYGRRSSLAALRAASGSRQTSSLPEMSRRVHSATQTTRSSTTSCRGSEIW